MLYYCRAIANFWNLHLFSYTYMLMLTNYNSKDTWKDFGEQPNLYGLIRICTWNTINIKSENYEDPTKTTLVPQIMTAYFILRDTRGCKIQTKPPKKTCCIYSPFKKIMENFWWEVIWQWLFSSGFRVNKMVMNKVNFFQKIAFKITQFISFFEISAK